MKIKKVHFDIYGRSLCWIENDPEMGKTLFSTQNFSLNKLKCWQSEFAPFYPYKTEAFLD